MAFVSPTKILMADLQGDRSYLLVFAAADASYELYLPGAGWPGEFTGYLTPSIRNQVTGQKEELPWDQAQKLATKLKHLLAAMDIAKGAEARARECVDALTQGRRYGVEA